MLFCCEKMHILAPPTLEKNQIMEYNKLVEVCLIYIGTKNNLELKKHETRSPVSVGNHKVHIE